MGRKKKNLVTTQSVRLTADLAALREKYSLDESFFRYAMRRYFRLCTHPYTIFDMVTGVKMCGVCKDEHYEDFTKWANLVPSEWQAEAGELVREEDVPLPLDDRFFE